MPAAAIHVEFIEEAPRDKYRFGFKGWQRDEPPADEKVCPHPQMGTCGSNNHKSYYQTRPRTCIVACAKAVAQYVMYYSANPPRTLIPDNQLPKG